jgi:hypothetical protein
MKINLGVIFRTQSGEINMAHLSRLSGEWPRKLYGKKIRIFWGNTCASAGTVTYTIVCGDCNPNPTKSQYTIGGTVTYTIFSFYLFIMYDKSQYTIGGTVTYTASPSYPSPPGEGRSILINLMILVRLIFFFIYVMITRLPDCQLGIL